MEEALRYFRFLMRDVRIAPTSRYFFSSPVPSPSPSPSPIYSPEIEMTVIRKNVQASPSFLPSYPLNDSNTEVNVEVHKVNDTIPHPMVNTHSISEMERIKGSVSFLLHGNSEVQACHPCTTSFSGGMTQTMSSLSSIHHETRLPCMESNVTQHLDPPTAVPKIKSIKLLYHPPQDSAIQLEPLPPTQPKKEKAPTKKPKVRGEANKKPTSPKKRQPKRKANQMELGSMAAASTPAKKRKPSNALDKPTVKCEQPNSRKRKQKEVGLEETTTMENSINSTQTKKRKRV